MADTVSRISLLDTPQNCVQIRSRLLGRNARLKPPKNKAYVLPPLIRQYPLYIERARQQNVGLAKELKPGGHHAYNLPAPSVKRQRLTDDGWIAAEAPAPDTHNSGSPQGASGPILIRRECTPQLWRDAERRKQIGCHLDGINLFRFASPRQICLPGRVCDQMVKSL